MMRLIIGFTIFDFRFSISSARLRNFAESEIQYPKFSSRFDLRATIEHLGAEERVAQRLARLNPLTDFWATWDRFVGHRTLINFDGLELGVAGAKSFRQFHDRGREGQKFFAG